MLEFLKAVLFGIVEGITEWLPISSTGHMIIVDHFIRMDEHFSKMFEVVVQLGSILSVLVYFHKKLFPITVTEKNVTLTVPRDVWQKVIVAVIPALIIGALFGSRIQEFLYNVQTVAIALIIGGIVLIAVDSTERENTSMQEFDQLSYRKVLGIGLIQCLAMIPGTSRSASTIIGGMCLGCSRPLSAEFSFFLAIPTMIAASGYSLLKYGANLSKTEWIALGLGFVTAFLVAWAVIAFFMAYIRKHDFKAFGWYRIALGVILLVLYFTRVI